MQFLSSLGYSELNFAGVGLIMADVGITFVNKSFYGDVFDVKISIGDFTKVSFDIYYLFTIQKDDKEKIIVKAKTGMVCFNYDQKKVTFIPKEIMKKLY